MSNTQIVFQLIGWGLLLFLSNRTLRRAEISRLKDQIIDLVDDLESWLEKQLEVKDSDKLLLERAYTSKVNRIDLLTQQLNQISKLELIDENKLNPFWNIDIISLYENSDLAELSELKESLTESIENQYFVAMFPKSFFSKLWVQYKPELLGFLTAAFSVYLLFEVFGIILG